jgi:hypothetical protein
MFKATVGFIRKSRKNPSRKPKIGAENSLKVYLEITKYQLD